MPYKDKAQLRAAQARWMARRRQAWLDANGPCEQCGSDKDLEVDHIDPSQKVSHRIWSWSDERRAAELAKCQVLCHVCHLAKSAAALWRPITHGTSNGYNRGCRCSKCADYHFVRNKSYRKRKKAAMVQ